MNNSLDGFNSRILVRELESLQGRARLQKFSQLTESDFLLHLRSPGRTDRLLISLHPEESRFHLIEAQHPAAIVPHSFVMLCRKQIGGTYLESIRQHGLDRRIEFSFSSGRSLIFDWAGRPPELMLLENETRKLKGVYPNRARHRMNSIYPPPEESHLLSLEADAAWETLQSMNMEGSVLDALGELSDEWSPRWKKLAARWSGSEKLDELEQDKFATVWTRIFAPLSGEGEVVAALESGKHLTYCAESSEFTTLHSACNQKWLASSATPGLEDYKNELLKTLKKQRERSQRKLKKRQQDKKGAESAPQDKMKGDLLLAYAYNLKRGAKVFETQDWEGREVKINLDPKLSATENADRYYNKSKKKKRALKVLEEQIALAREEIDVWDELIFSAQTSEDRTDLEQVRKSMPTGRQKKSKRKMPQTPSSGPRRFRHQDFLILVGRNPTQNEKLSLKTAAKDDHWFHVRQGAGSHVVIKCAGAEPPPETVEAAAWLAASFSQSAESDSVAVVTTRARFLKKPKGGPIGKVIYRQEREMTIRPTQAKPNGLEQVEQ